MAEIGIKRLRAGDREEHRAERHQADAAVAAEEAQGMPGIEREEHSGTTGDVVERGDRDRDEPDQHHGAEECRDLCRARDCTANSATRITTVSGTT